MIWLELSAGVFVVLLVHEIGHLLLARLLGIRVVGISIGLGPTIFSFEDSWKTRWTLGVLPVKANIAVWNGKAAGRLSPCDALSDKSPKQQAAFYLAGPVFSLLLGLLLIEIAILWPDQVVENNGWMIASLLGGFSIAIGGFNLLPLPPLDGGKLVLLWIETRGRALSEYS